MHPTVPAAVAALVSTILVLPLLLRRAWPQASLPNTRLRMVLAHAKEGFRKGHPDNRVHQMYDIFTPDGEAFALDDRPGARAQREDFVEDFSLLRSRLADIAPLTPRPMLRSRSGDTILIVDDEPDLLEIASTYLDCLGYRTITACGSTEALNRVAEFSAIDLMLTDIIMPGGINGVELAQRVRAVKPSIKVLYASGLPADALSRRNLLVGNTALLNKPYLLADLSNAIRSALESPDCTIA